MKPTYILNKGSMTLHYNGKTTVIAKGDWRFEKVIEAIRANRLDELPEIADNEEYFERQGIKVESGILKLDGEEMPKALADRMEEYRSNNLPLTSLMAFWENLKLNPSFNSRKQLFAFLENKGHSLTEDGHFIGYRGVTEDFKDKHTRTFNNAPGSICEIPREQVDDNPDNTCSHGLHVGGFEYAKDFGPKLVLVKVNPKDVVAVPNDYNGQKMRVCRFEVLQETNKVEEKAVFGDVKPLPKRTSVELNSKCEQCKDYEYPLTEGLCDGCLAEQKPKKKKKRSLASYANNHAKRGPDGKFAPKKKKLRGGSRKKAR